MGPFAFRSSVALAVSAATLALLACGSRSGLLADGPWEPDPIDPDDDTIPRLDAGVRDAREDLPELDSGPDVRVDQRDCRDPNETLVYLVSSSYDLYSFNPRTMASRVIGPIVCPASSEFATPFSMAVDRQGVAYVVYNNGELFRISTLTAACAATDFVPNQPNIDTFGMGFASDQGGPEETLFIATTEFNDSNDLSRLGAIRIPSFDVDLLGSFVPDVKGAELTGTGDGRLFAFYTKSNEAGSYIGQVDKASGQLVAESYLPTVDQQNAWAFAFWGGDFYTFTAPSEQASTVTRFRPSTGATEVVATIPTPIVGAGVSTCSPVE